MATSISDDRLAVWIASGIFTDQLFLNLSMTITPPITWRSKTVV